MKMREFIIKSSQARARVRRLEVEKLEKEINELENQLVSAPSKNIVDKIEDKKKNQVYLNYTIIHDRELESVLGPSGLRKGKITYNILNNYLKLIKGNVSQENYIMKAMLLLKKIMKY